MATCSSPALRPPLRYGAVAAQLAGRGADVRLQAPAAQPGAVGPLGLRRRADGVRLRHAAVGAHQLEGVRAGDAEAVPGREVNLAGEAAGAAEGGQVALRAGDGPLGADLAGAMVRGARDGRADGQAAPQRRDGAQRLRVAGPLHRSGGRCRLLGGDERGQVRGALRRQAGLGALGVPGLPRRQAVEVDAAPVLGAGEHDGAVRAAAAVPGGVAQHLVDARPLVLRAVGDRRHQAVAAVRPDGHPCPIRVDAQHARVVEHVRELGQQLLAPLRADGAHVVGRVAAAHADGEAVEVADVVVDRVAAAVSAVVGQPGRCSGR